MGCVGYVDYDKFPKQGKHLGKDVEVCFHYNTKRLIKGKVVRDDMDNGGLMLIQLEDGRFVKSTECQYSVL